MLLSSLGNVKIPSCRIKPPATSLFSGSAVITITYEPLGDLRKKGGKFRKWFRLDEVTTGFFVYTTMIFSLSLRVDTITFKSPWLTFKNFPAPMPGGTVHLRHGVLFLYFSLRKLSLSRPALFQLNCTENRTVGNQSFVIWLTRDWVLSVIYERSFCE